MEGLLLLLEGLMGRILSWGLLVWVLVLTLLLGATDSISLLLVLLPLIG